MNEKHKIKIPFSILFAPSGVVGVMVVVVVVVVDSSFAVFDAVNCQIGLQRKSWPLQAIIKLRVTFLFRPLTF